MKKVKKYSILMLLLLAIMFINTSCKKKGCTDKNADNYCAKCGDNDGTCTYTGKIVFWYNQTTSQILLSGNYPATSLKYYVNGTLVGSSATSVYWNSAPNCGQSVTVEKNLGKNKTGSYSYSVKDQDDFEWWSGNIEFKANTCLTYELN